MSMGNVLGRTILTLSHLGWVWMLVYTGRMRFWTMFVAGFMTMLNSIMMHLCQISPQYGLTDHNLCWVGSGTDVQTGTSLADYVTAYTILVQFAVYGPDVPELLQAVWTLVYYSLNIAVISTYAPSLTGPAILNVILIAIPVIARVTLLHRAGELDLFYERHISIFNLVSGLVVLLLGIAFYYVQTDDNYIWTHALWMFIAPIGFCFLLRTFDPKVTFLQDLYFCIKCCIRARVKDPKDDMVTLQKLSHDYTMVHVKDIQPPTPYRFTPTANSSARREKVNIIVVDSIRGVHF
jgi:hypothetical protein